MKLTLAYFGTPLFSAYFLEKLLTDDELKKIIDIKLVVTQSDKPVGKKQILTPSPVKETAIKYQISNIKYQKDIKNLKFEIRNFDLSLLYAFGKIIPKELLTLPKYGFWCIHPSLLPKYRGPSPIAYVLILGEKETGTTIFQMDEKIDHGPVITQEKLKILPADRRPELERKLTDLAFNLFKKLIITNFNQFQLITQADNLATYTRLLKKEDGFIPLEILKKAVKNKPLNFEELPKILQEIKNCKLKIENSAKIIYNLFRGLYPWPGIWTIIPNGKRLKITDMKIENDRLKIIRVQLEGKREVDFKTFNKAYSIFT